MEIRVSLYRLPGAVKRKTETYTLTGSPIFVC